MRSGDAVRRNGTTVLAAHRHRAQPARSISSGAGPWPDSLASGLRSTPAGGSTPVSTTQAPTRRGPRAMRTRVPTCTWSSQPGGTR
jgi:hypothetical protein